MNLFARLISLISNPLFISIPMSYAIVFKSKEDFLYAIEWTFISLVFTIAIGLFVFYGVKKGIFSDFDISKRQERNAIFIFTILIGIIYFAVIFFLQGPRVLLLALAALLLGTLIADLINRKIKASIHIAVFSSFSIVVGILYGGIFWLIPFFTPLVAWSRIKLKRHHLSETIVGWFLGASLVLLLYYIVKYFYKYG